MTPHFLSLCSHRMPQPCWRAGLTPVSTSYLTAPPPGRDGAVPSKVGMIIKRLHGLDVKVMVSFR